MNEEFRHVKGYKAWHESRNVTDKEEKLFRKITTLRNNLLKEVPLQLKVRTDKISLEHELFSDIMMECREYFFIITKIMMEC